MKQLIWFTHQFSILNRAGMGFSVSLKLLQRSCTDKKLQIKIGGILQEVERGQSFSNALACYPELCDAFYVEMIKVGEETGCLTEVLSELQHYWERQYHFKQESMRALLYPTLVMIMMVVLTLGLCITVIPKFQHIFASFHAPLPWITGFLFNSVDFFKHYFLFILVAAGGGGWLGRQFVKPYIFLILQDPRILKIPVLGAFFQARLLFKFYRVLAIALKAGLSLQKSIELMRRMFKSTPLKSLIPLLEYDLKNGRRLTEVFDREIYFPPMCQGFIHIAEETGTLDQQFFNLAGIFEEQVSVALERFKTLLEPVMMLLTGVLVGGIVLAIYYPIFSLGSVF